MKKFKISLVVAAVLVAVLIPAQSAFAATTASVTVNVTPVKLSISVYNQGGEVSPGTWTITDIYNSQWSLCDADRASVGQDTDPGASAPVAASCGYDVKNNNTTTAIKIQAKAQNMKNGGDAAWTLGAAVSDAGAYTAYIGKAETAYVQMTTADTYVDWIASAAGGSTSSFTMKIQAPGDWTTDPSGDQTSWLTLKAVKAS